MTATSIFDARANPTRMLQLPHDLHNAKMLGCHNTVTVSGG